MSSSAEYIANQLLHSPHKSTAGQHLAPMISIQNPPSVVVVPAHGHRRHSHYRLIHSSEFNFQKSKSIEQCRLRIRQAQAW
jgi:hypothetical protein